MKKIKNFEDYIYKVINKYQKILLLDKHTFELKNVLENKDALMECRFNYPYLNITFNYGEKIIEKWKSGDDIIPFIVHEMCHPITDPLYAKAILRHTSETEILDEREKLTDYICNIVIKNFT